MDMPQTAAASTATLSTTEIPSRKTIREWLRPYRERSTGRAVSLLGLDLLLFAAALTATVLLRPLALKLLFGALTGFIIGRLFIIGHDACHQALTDNKRLNNWLGRIAFLPSLTPYSLWEVGHNTVHHGYTNLKQVDFVWAPLTPEEYAALPRWRQRLERLYRSGWGPGLYYLVEVWWLRMFFPSRRYMSVQRRGFLGDTLLVSAAALIWLAGLLLAAQLTGQSVILLLLTGFVLPFLFWSAMVGFVIYVHHTHIAVSWHRDKLEWARAIPNVTTTVHLKFRHGVGGLLHHIMEHTAHHVDMSIPLYHLKAAQRCLEAAMPGRIIIQNFSWRWYFDTARRCKLFDFEQNCWTDFRGQPSC